MNLTLDEEAIELIRDYENYMGDESYANHLAVKILELWRAQR